MGIEIDRESPIRRGITVAPIVNGRFMGIGTMLTHSKSTIDGLPPPIGRSSASVTPLPKPRSNTVAIETICRSLILALLAIALSSFYTSAQAQVFTSQDADSRATIAPMLEHVTPAVVNVSVTGQRRVPPHPFFDDPFFRRFFDLPYEGPAVPYQAVGSGVVVDGRNGYILTNHHVVADADEIVIATQDQRQFDAELVGSDEGTDVAVLKIDADALHAIEIGDSDELRVGDFVAAIGNPFGLGQTVTFGIISALGRSGLGAEKYENFIQTDASINIGNSGGALVDFNGELIGINTAIMSPGGGNVGIGFAIPINMARAIMNQIIEHGVVRRGRLGVLIQDITPELAQALGLTVTDGVIITKVEPGSAADRAGLQSGDVIIRVDGDPVTHAGQLRNLIGLMRVGDQLNITYIRNGKTKEAQARIREFIEEGLAAPRIVPKLSGAEFRNMPSAHPLYGEIRGVIVTRVEPGSPAAQLGLRRGDVVAAVNKDRITLIKELSEAIRSANKPIALDIIRGSARFYIVIR